MYFTRKLWFQHDFFRLDVVELYANMLSNTCAEEILRKYSIRKTEAKNHPTYFLSSTFQHYVVRVNSSLTIFFTLDEYKMLNFQQLQNVFVFLINVNT